MAYKIKVNTGEKVHGSDVLLAEGFEHNYPSPDKGDIAIVVEGGDEFHLAGKDAIAWQQVDEIIDFINEIATKPGFAGRVPDSARPYVERFSDDSGKRIRTQEEIMQIDAAMDRLQDKLKHVLTNFDWSDFPAVDKSEFELKVYHDSVDDGGIIAPEDTPAAIVDIDINDFDEVEGVDGVRTFVHKGNNS